MVYDIRGLNVCPICFRFTKQGSLKERAELSPKNGYYFLPLYDKGEYILKVSRPMF